MTAARLVRGFAACLLAAAGLLVVAPAAQAGTPTFEFLSPTKGQTLADPNVNFHLRVSMTNSDGRLQNQVVVDFAVPAGAPGIAQITRNAHDQRSIDVIQSLGTLRWNGTYRADARAQGRTNVLDNDTAPRSDNATFVVDALPAAPSGVRADADDESRVVTVTWAPNTEPDLIGYKVEKRASDGRWVHFAATADTRVNDQSTAYAGGTYRYRVAAVRRAADSRFANQSAFTETSTTVPAPPVNTPPPPPEEDRDGDGEPDSGTGGSGGGTGGTGGGTGGTGGGGSGSGSGGGFSSENRRGSGSPGLASSGKVDISDFQQLLAEAERQNRPPGAPPEDEGTYDPNLPFAARQGGGDDDGDGEDAGDEPLLGLGDGDDVAGRVQSLGFLAGGLLATVLAMHVLWVRSEVHRADKADALAPDPDPAPSGS